MITYFWDALDLIKNVWCAANNLYLLRRMPKPSKTGVENVTYAAALKSSHGHWQLYWQGGPGMRPANGLLFERVVLWWLFPSNRLWKYPSYGASNLHRPSTGNIVVFALEPASSLHWGQRRPCTGASVISALGPSGIPWGQRRPLGPASSLHWSKRHIPTLHCMGPASSLHWGRRHTVLVSALEPASSIHWRQRRPCTGDSVVPTLGKTESKTHSLT